jgi:hypothetical protein
VIDPSEYSFESDSNDESKHSEENALITKRQNRVMSSFFGKSIDESNFEMKNAELKDSEDF